MNGTLQHVFQIVLRILWTRLKGLPHPRAVVSQESWPRLKHASFYGRTLGSVCICICCCRRRCRRRRQERLQSGHQSHSQGDSVPQMRRGFHGCLSLATRQLHRSIRIRYGIDRPPCGRRCGPQQRILRSSKVVFGPYPVIVFVFIVAGAQHVG